MSSEYFKNLLNNETCRLEDLCSEWELFLENNSISKECPDDAVGEILRVIGLTKLLLESKLPQFEKLINSLDNREYDKRIMTSEDLQGFWDLVSIQILDVDKKFASLNLLKNNKWIVINKGIKPKKLTERSKSLDVKMQFDQAYLTNGARKRLAMAKARMQQQSLNTEDQFTFPRNGSESTDSVQCTNKTPVKDCDLPGARVTIC